MKRSWLQASGLPYVVVYGEPSLPCPFHYDDNRRHLRVQASPDPLPAGFPSKLLAALEVVDWLYKPEMGVLCDRIGGVALSRQPGPIQDFVFPRLPRLHRYLRRNVQKEFESSASTDLNVFRLGRRALDALINPSSPSSSSSGETTFLRITLEAAGIYHSQHSSLVTGCLRRFLKEDNLVFYEARTPTEFDLVTQKPWVSPVKAFGKDRWVWILLVVLLVVVCIWSLRTPQPSKSKAK